MCFHEEQTLCVYSNCTVLKFHFRAVDIQYSIHNNIIKIVNILGNIAFLDVPFTTLKQSSPTIACFQLYLIYSFRSKF